MNSELYSKINSLSKELDDFYSRENSFSHDDYFENKKIKTKIVHLILDAKNSGEIEFADKVLMFLFENTGCYEELLILNEISKPLFDAEILNAESLDKYLIEYSPLSRWL
ncbi:hypothetical protein ACP179_15680 [Xenorhabdus stockiae]|uniref:hypothetical protein n=1 Tax=Xenorhabdus stockiae TaxID=351614 RepID=UPI003CF9CCFC